MNEGIVNSGKKIELSYYTNIIGKNDCKEKFC